MTLQEAHKAAQAFADKTTWPGVSAIVELTDELSNCFCFKLWYEEVADGAALNGPPVTSGFQGVIVKKAGMEVGYIWREEYRALLAREKEINEAYELLSGIKHRRGGWSVLSSKYGLNPTCQLALMKALENFDIDKMSSPELLNFLVSEVKLTCR